MNVGYLQQGRFVEVDMLCSVFFQLLAFSWIELIFLFQLAQYRLKCLISLFA